MTKQEKEERGNNAMQLLKRKHPKVILSRAWNTQVIKTNFAEFTKEFWHEYCRKVNPQLQKARYAMCHVEYTCKTSFLTIFLFTLNCCSENHQTQPFFVMLPNCRSRHCS